MKNIALIIFSLFCATAISYAGDCFCKKKPMMTESTVSCDTTFLTNQSKLYWQFNCDRIWLTLESASGNQVVINEVPVKYYAYTYRLGYNLIKEYDNSLLFRGSCTASDPCVYTLIDKFTGQKQEEFDRLICIDTEIDIENPHKYEFDFVVYLSSENDEIFVQYINENRIVGVPFKEKFASKNPEKQFTKMTVDNNILTIFYNGDDNLEKNIKIDLNLIVKN